MRDPSSDDAYHYESLQALSGEFEIEALALDETDDDEGDDQFRWTQTVLAVGVNDESIGVNDESISPSSITSNNTIASGVRRFASLLRLGSVSPRLSRLDRRARKTPVRTTQSSGSPSRRRRL